MMTFPRRDPGCLAETIVAWLKERGSLAGAQGGIVGLSGGLDSAVVAVLLQRAFGSENMLAVFLPCRSLEGDRRDSQLLVDAFGLPYREIDLTSACDALLSTIEPPALSKLSAANIKPRLRMTTLYALAQTRGFLVCGTSNRPELYMGYSTKYGDGGCDLQPLGDLLKSEVRSLAVHLKIPDPIIVKPPSAGLWEGQTDEREIGLSYDEIDGYLATGTASAAVREKLHRMNAATEHKRTMPPICVIDAQNGASCSNNKTFGG